MKTFERVRAFLATPELAALGPGPRGGVQPEPVLNRELESVFRTGNLSEQNRELVRALVLLWHDHLEGAHRIAQEIGNIDGAFVHGIVHRREPDYGNAQYWFRRVGRHPVFPELAMRVGHLLEPAPAKPLRERLLPKGEWDPIGFVNLCEWAAERPAQDEQVQLLRAVQRLETEVLLERFAG